jgi:hypothetical protein
MTSTRPYPWTALVEALGDGRFDEIKGEIAAARADPFDRDAFVLGAAAGRLLRDLVPDDAPSEAVTAYATLLHVLYVHWLSGRPVRAVRRERLNPQLTAPPPPPAPALGACYLQLPERLVWAAPATGAAHEPLDGLFVMTTSTRLQVLAVLGFRQEREGFTTIEAAAPLPATAAPLRADGAAPFSTVLPAGERMGFHSVTSEAELAWLALLALGVADG